MTSLSEIDREKRIRDGHQARQFLDAPLTTEIFAEIRTELLNEVLKVSDIDPLKRDALRQACVDEIHALDRITQKLKTRAALLESELARVQGRKA